MRFTPTDVDGCWIVDAEPYEDSRGGFARAYCVQEFAAHGIDATVLQANLSWNTRAGTLRGLHRQVAPAAEGKLIRCLRGELVDCCLDLREDSSTFGRPAMVTLSAANRRALWIPPYCAHGFITLVDDTEMLYMMSGMYAPEHERGQRHDDPAFALTWPREVAVISDKDRAWPAWDGRPLP